MERETNSYALWDVLAFLCSQEETQSMLSENLRWDCPRCWNPLTWSHCDTCCG
jgi:hypothetical protein